MDAAANAGVGGKGTSRPSRFPDVGYDLAYVDRMDRLQASSTFDSGQQIRYCSFLNRSWKISWPQVRPRACTSAPPSLNFPNLTGANPSCLAKAATGAIASLSSLDRKMTRWPPSTIGFGSQGGGNQVIETFTNLAPVNAFATKPEDGRPSRSSGEPTRSSRR